VGVENNITLRNIASFYLFDRTNEPIRRVLNAEKKLEKLKEELSRQIKLENFLRCNSIQKEINKLTSQLA
jgi:protein-arginine kinase activator protein McsA